MRVLVVGLGTFGGGIGVTRFLAERGDEVRVTDLKTADALADSLAKLADLPGIVYRLGEHLEEDLDWAEMIVASPAVPPQAPYLQAARDRELPITSEIRLFVEGCPAPIAAVTGSNGKSTTTRLLASILEADGRTVHLGGNLGRSLLSVPIDAGDWVVLELSSFQLDDLAHLAWAPRVGVLTNLTPNHLDRHGTMAAYTAAKRNLFLHQRPEDAAVFNADDAASAAFAEGLPGAPIWCPGERYRLADGALLEGDATLLPAGALPLPGAHNLTNALMAAAAARAIGASPEAVTAALSTATALPHRLEPVGEHAGRRFVNDSVATTPESTIAALEAFNEPITLLLGGKDKGVPLEPLAEAVRRRAAHVVLFGALGERIAPLLEGSVRTADGFHAAFDVACELADAGVVLLSPAASSYDEFRNFEARGEAFRRRVAALSGSGSS